MSVVVIGVDTDGAEAFRAALPHGSDPDTVAHGHGFAVRRPVDAVRDADGDIVLRVSVESAGDRPAPRPRLRGKDRGLELDGVEPLVRQRVAAYAVVLSERGLLATEYSDRTAVADRWGMPGGGIDDGEEPSAAVLREVAEETSQSITLGELINVQTSHWIGRNPDATVEDFHAVRLIYRGYCNDPTEPVVLDLGGTTESAAWIPLDRWASVAWTVNWQTVLGELLADIAQ